jgi:hypothetical protein
MWRSSLWMALAVLLFLTWVVSYFAFHVTDVLIHLLLFFALTSCMFMFYTFIGKRGVE